ncbi:MAG: HK97 family phage prohead protease [Pseudooceanicola sp.]|jgi:HK97 family phage prohead protease|nr:HK97 family phage prohead protease [Pseudooceanicola sp.]
MEIEGGLEHKFARFGTALRVDDAAVIEGYASLFDEPDQSGDIVRKGAYDGAIERLAETGRKLKMLWQHDPAQPIGVWDEVRSDARGLWVKGRILDSTQCGREAVALIGAGAIDGLSIGYRTVRATKDDKGHRVLIELDLWEVSLVTFPMLASARVSGKADDPGAWAELRELAEALERARQELVRL